MKIPKRFAVGAKLKIVHEYGHDYNYTGSVVAADKESITIQIDNDGSTKPLRCVLAPYGLDYYFECEDGRSLNLYVVKDKPKLMTSQLIKAAAVIMCFPESDKHYLGSSMGVQLRDRYAKELEKEANPGFELRIRLLDAINEACQHEDDIDVTDMLEPADLKIIAALLAVA